MFVQKNIDELKGVYELRTFVWTTRFLCVAFLFLLGGGRGRGDPWTIGVPEHRAQGLIVPSLLLKDWRVGLVLFLKHSCAALLPMK